jgi:hypothetical protein
MTQITAQRLQSRAGGYLSAARTSPEQKKAQGAKGMHNLIAKKMDPDGELERTDPREFDRQFKAAVRAHMAEMGARHSAKTAQRREDRETYQHALSCGNGLSGSPHASKGGYLPLVLVTACADCNREAGGVIPRSVVQRQCVTHWLGTKSPSIIVALFGPAEPTDRP